MATMQIRPATVADLPALTEIYNHYVLHTPVTFDVEAFTAGTRRAWFDQFAATGRYRLLLAALDANILGYAGTTRFRAKPCYDTTVETTIYCRPASGGTGVGSKLYAALFEELRREDIHRIVAGYVLPNAASAALHRKFGFKEVGVFTANGRKFGKYWDVQWLERPLVV
jgi:phosphinothricin acetyltransferase